MIHKRRTFMGRHCIVLVVGPLGRYSDLLHWFVQIKYQMDKIKLNSQHYPHMPVVIQNENLISLSKEMAGFLKD